MAYILKCKSKAGTFTLTELSFDSTVEDLKVILSKLIGVKQNAIKILVGSPPKPLETENDNSKLIHSNIYSGETIFIEIKKDEPEEAAQGAHGKDIGAALLPEEENIEDVRMNPAPIMLRHVVPANNSCLFTSIKYCLTGGSGNNDSKEYRKIVANVIKNNPVKYNEGFLEKPNKAYSAWIRDPNNWGGAIELSILSEHFEIEIVVIDILNLTVHRFGETDDYPERIFLIYNGFHYDPLVLKHETSIQTIFATADQESMNMAVDFAREAESKHETFNEYDFSLTCRSCKSKINGPEEALEHKRLTGHDKFDPI
ncbi:ubiquitin thioesterase OTU1 [Nephila pilipes]|uniref:Ubiquitin thioesterase OTU n=1 Tax=Nephila pilipes TaxID=299642 RepID=A0A8X6Q839_NEPPI|nr:ubiquitin thioesterase OTU1 [Nephila pilipes]